MAPTARRFQILTLKEEIEALKDIGQFHSVGKKVKPVVDPQYNIFYTFDPRKIGKKYYAVEGFKVFLKGDNVPSGKVYRSVRGGNPKFTLKKLSGVHPSNGLLLQAENEVEVERVYRNAAGYWVR